MSPKTPIVCQGQQPDMPSDVHFSCLHSQSAFRKDWRRETEDVTCFGQPILADHKLIRPYRSTPVVIASIGDPGCTRPANGMHSFCTRHSTVAASYLCLLSHTSHFVNNCMQVEVFWCRWQPFCSTCVAATPCTWSWAAEQQRHRATYLRYVACMFTFEPHSDLTDAVMTDLCNMT